MSSAKNQDLSPRERDVLNEIIDGWSNSQIAKKLNLSIRTIESHRSNVIQKTNSRNMYQAIARAIKKGYIVV